MSQDPFYQQITKGLEGELDPVTFERCVVDLLAEVYPGLTPMPGGQDAGMDGAIAEGEGEPYPLVVTTAADVIGNLTRSLTSYIEAGRSRRNVVLATSRRLTARRVQNLYDRAAELGFTLINVHHQQDIANRLYFRPEWCRELLNLAGRPAALSVVALSTRPIVNRRLIGRADSLSWLHETEGDRLLVGQPGSGKTYLLHRFAMDGGGLFLVDEDREAIAAGVRSLQPSSIIVDDAQVKHELLENLLQLRRELGANFSIVSSCWKGDQEEVARGMNLPVQNIDRLALLTRDQIVSVIKDVGIAGPNELIGEIVNQAHGKPGLAAILAHMCLQGRTREVYLGEELNRTIQTYYRPRLGDDAVSILAALALGGGAGMRLEVVANGLEMRLVNVRQIAIQLGASGILWEVGDDRLAVFPEPLRFTLVRDVFFQGAYSLPVELLIGQTPNLAETADVLIGARARGAIVSDAELRRYLERANDAEVWEHYCWLGRQEALWVLESHPELTPVLTKPALAHTPDIVLPRLFKAAVGDDRRLNSAPDHPLRQIDAWVKAAWPGRGQTIERRSVLQGELLTWLESGGDATIGLQVLNSVLSPESEDIQTDPGAGNTVTWRHAFLLLDELREIQELWPEVLAILQGLNIGDWKPLQNLVWTWVYTLSDGKIPDELIETKRDFGFRLLRDVAELAQDHPGILQWARQISLDFENDLQVAVDPIYDLLYPAFDRPNWREEEQEHKPRVQNLATTWVDRDPRAAAEHLLWLFQEAQLAEQAWSRWPAVLCEEISSLAENPEDWAEALMETACEGRQVWPFLKQAAEQKRPNWTELIRDSLRSRLYKGVAISIILTMNDPPSSLLDECLAEPGSLRQIVETHCLRGEVPEITTRRLLAHPDRETAASAAYGEWYADPKVRVREPLMDEWRRAAMNSTHAHFLEDIFSEFPALAFSWLRQMIEQRADFSRFGKAVSAAAASLDRDDKQTLLALIPPEWSYSDVVNTLVGSDVDMYRLLLGEEGLKIFHLVPLNWHSGEEWVEKLIVALESYSPEEVARAAFGGYPVRVLEWTGKRSLEMKKWVDRFAILSTHENEGVREVGRIGMEAAEQERQETLQRERQEEIYGYQRRPGRAPLNR